MNEVTGGVLSGTYSNCYFLKYFLFKNIIKLFFTLANLKIKKNKFRIKK